MILPRILIVPWAFALASLLGACASASAPSASATVVTTTRAAATPERASDPLASDPLATNPAWEPIPTDDSRRLADVPDVAAPVPACVGRCDVEGGSCADARGWQCQCAWQYDEVCGGAYRQPNPPVLAWQCAPADVGADRGDGCPFGEPTARAQCHVREDLLCRYATGCGYQGVDATCVAGRWTLTRFAMPPPP